MDKKKIAFAEKLNEKILEKGITKAELSRLISVSDTTISDYTKGRRKPHPLFLKRIADVFNCSPDDLYEY